MRSTSLIRSVRGAAFGATLLAVVTVAGCSRPVGSVSGKVTFGNKTLKGGNVTFISTEGLPSQSSGITEEGTYSVPSLTAGTYKVCVETESLKPPGFAGPPMGAGAPKGTALDPDTPIPEGYHPSNPAEASLAGAAARAKKLYVAIPGQYADPNKTDLQYTVVGGQQTYNIELK